MMKIPKILISAFWMIFLCPSCKDSQEDSGEGEPITVITQTEVRNDFESPTSNNPAQASAIFERLRSDDPPNIDEFEDLIYEGVFVSHLAEAAEIIKDRYGPGNKRNRLLSALLLSSERRFDGDIKFISQFESELEREALVVALSIKVMSNGPEGENPDYRLENLNELHELSHEELKLFVDNVAKPIYFADQEVSERYWTAQRLSDLTQLAQMMSEGSSDGILADYLRRIAWHAPKQISKHLENSPNLSEEERTTIYAEVASGIARSNPREALSYVVDNESFKTVVTEWLRQDSREVGRWFEENRDKMDQSHADGAAAAFGEVAVKKGELVTARAWADEIKDASSRQKVLDEVWLAERKLIRERLDEDPALTLASLSSTDSGFPQFWINEAFRDWAQVDGHSARLWYEENRSSLSPSQNQHIARVYANQAIRDGNLDLARQWQAQVIDPKFVEVIRGEIERAEEASSGD